MSDNLPPGISRDDTVHGEIYYTAAQVRAAIEASRAAVPAGPDVQWQKRHPLRTEGAWENTQEHDAKWWRDHSQGWEIRVLYAHPVTQAKPEQAVQPKARTPKQLADDVYAAPSLVKSKHTEVTEAGTEITRLELTDDAKRMLSAKVTHIPEAQEPCAACITSVVGAGPNDVGIQWRGGFARNGEFLYRRPQPVAQPGEVMPTAPDGRLHDDGYFTWNPKKHPNGQRPVQLPRDFWLSAAPVTQAKPEQAAQPMTANQRRAGYETLPIHGQLTFSAFMHGVDVAESHHGIQASPKPKD